MNELIPIPADADKATLQIERERGGATLRSLLPCVHGDVELVIEDVVSVEQCDRVVLRANCGGELAKKLTRSRVLEGEFLLDLKPSCIQAAELPGMGTLEIYVTNPKPED